VPLRASGGARLPACLEQAGFSHGVRPSTPHTSAARHGEEEEKVEAGRDSRGQERRRGATVEAGLRRTGGVAERSAGVPAPAQSGSSVAAPRRSGGVQSWRGLRLRDSAGGLNESWALPRRGGAGLG